PIAIEQCLGMRPRTDGKLPMLGDLERSDTQSREPALGETQDVALLAQLEVLLGEREAVVGFGDGLEPGRRDVVGRLRDEDAERLDRSTTDAAAQLVELGE